jgi:purine-cytosine permease-like protein
VASTFVTGATIRAGMPLGTALGHIAAGSLVGAALVASLAPVGSRWGAPSLIALRAPLGRPGAHLVAAILYLTNFAWIALNNSVAASVASPLLPGVDPRVSGAALGLFATALVLGGPRATALANRAAVPLMVVAGVYLATLAASNLSVAAPPREALGSWRALDIAIAYQVSWILMFADYSRYTRSPRAAGWSVFAALAITSVLGMALGAALQAVSGSVEPGAMLRALGVPALGVALIAAATVTTNFVNIYLSALAVRSLVPRIPEGAAVAATGAVGAALSLASDAWIEGYAGFMGALGMILVPLGGVALAQFYPFPAHIRPERLYADDAPFARANAAGLAAWAAGAAVYWAFAERGATLPSLAVSFTLFALLRRAGRADQA